MVGCAPVFFVKVTLYSSMSMEWGLSVIACYGGLPIFLHRYESERSMIYTGDLQHHTDAEPNNKFIKYLKRMILYSKTYLNFIKLPKTV